MSELNVSGDIFTLDARAGFDEGIVRGKVGSGARMSFAGEFELCHGLSAELSARASAEITAGLGLLWLLAGRAQVQGIAAAGINLNLKFDVDLFDTMGFMAEAEAYAEAAVAARLAVGLDIQDIARLARPLPLMQGLAYDIFIAFLNEVTIEAGVWAKLAAAAMAKANLNIRGSLRDDDNAGFYFEFALEAAAAAGVGIEVFSGVHFKNPKRFFLTASERITTELVDQARRLLPAQFSPIIEYLELLLPIALNAAYELGQQAALQSLASPNQLAKPLLENFGAQLQRYVIEKFVEIGIRETSSFLESLIAVGLREDFSDSERQVVASSLRVLLDQLSTKSLTPASFAEILTILVDILVRIAPAQAEYWQRPVSITWLALASAGAMRDHIGSASASASASAGLVGLGTATAPAEVIFLGTPPRIVQDELQQFYGGLATPARLEFRHAVEYLVKIGLESLDKYAVPQIWPILDRLAQVTDVTVGTLVESALLATFGSGIDGVSLYHKLRAFIKEGIDDQITAVLMPELRRRVPADSDAAQWLNQAAEPSLLMLSNFTLEQLDRAVGGIGAAEQSPFLHTFQAAMSQMIGRIVVRNVVVLNDIMLDNILRQCSQLMRALAQTLRMDPRHVLSTAGLELINQVLPIGAVEQDVLASATRQLLAEMLDAGAVAWSDKVWTNPRRQRLQGLSERLMLSIDGDVDQSNADEVRNFLKTLLECSYVPDPDGLVALATLLGEILADQAMTIAPRAWDALSEFWLALTAKPLRDMVRLARQFIRQSADLVADAFDAYQYWSGELARWIDEGQAAARELQRQLAALSDLLRNPATRGKILDRIRQDGIAEARRLVRSRLGFELLPAVTQNLAISTAVSTFDKTFDEVLRPILDGALTALARVVNDVASLVANATNLSELIQRLAQSISDSVEEAVRDAFGVAAKVLPKELTIVGIATTAATVVTELQPVRDSLRQALDARDRERQAKREQDRASQQKKQMHDRWMSRDEDHKSLLGGPLRVDILSPGEIKAEANKNFSYGRTAPVLIRIRGARPSFLEDNARRVFLSLNGTELELNHTHWSYDEKSQLIFIRMTLNWPLHRLHSGVNMLECSVDDGQSNTIRAKMLFSVTAIAMPDLSAIPAHVTIDPTRSVFRALESNPRRLLGEHVTIRHERDTFKGTVNLQGWSMLNRARQRFTLGQAILEPGQSVIVYTGKYIPSPIDLSGNSSESTLYLGSSEPIWNDDMDTVYLVDTRGLVRDEYTFFKA